jgi:hypothetical protein
MVQFNPLTPELNPSAQHCLTRLFTGDFASGTVNYVNICVKNQQIHQLFIQLLSVVATTCFGITFPSQIAARHVTRHNTLIHNILSTAPQLSVSQKALGTLPEDGNVLPKHVGATIHN